MQFLIPIRPWQLLLLLLALLAGLTPLVFGVGDRILNGRTDLAIARDVDPDRALAPLEPLQVNLPGKTPPIAHKTFTLYPVARFELIALILSKNEQGGIFGDLASELSPLDLALGWGRMSVPSELAKLTIWQRGRFYFWQVRDGERFDPRSAIPLSTNVHLIPATPEIRDRLMRAREGDLIRLEGRLVNAFRPDLGWWRSSRSRTDTGDGACEIMLVEQVTLRPGVD